MIKYFAIQTVNHNRLWQRSGLVTKALLVLLGSLIIAASAQISLPVQPVPVTLQSFSVILLAMVGGWRFGLFTTVTYLIEGAIGLPVFAGFMGGLTPLLAPTGGYLFAFPVAATIAGFLAQRGWGKHIILSFITAILGLFIILAIGTLYFAMLAGVKTAVSLGLMPFLLDEVCKGVMLAVMVPFFWRSKQ